MPESVEGKIRILIVDDIAETRENIRKLLQFEADFAVVGSARTGDEALQVAIETQPDVVLMDINMPDMDGITATEAILEQVQFAQIVILSVQSDADYMRRAMLAGARDFIAKPPSGDELVATIRRVAVRAKAERERRPTAAQVAATAAAERLGGPSRPEGRAITVYSAKGGVGVTMLATNLAVGLNTAETPTVLVDTSLQFGDVAVCLNLQPKNSVADMASRADELDADVMEEVLINHESGLKVLAAPVRPEVADEVKPDQVRKVLQFLKRNFAYVVIDTSSALDDVTLAVLDVTDMLVAVATPEIPAIKDARSLFELLSQLEFPRNNVFFVLNKMDKRSGITSEKVADNLKHAVDGEIPYDEHTITTSINKGVPLLMIDKGRPPGKNILELLGAIKQRLVQQSRETPDEEKAERSKAGR